MQRVVNKNALVVHSHNQYDLAMDPKANVKKKTLDASGGPGTTTNAPGYVRPFRIKSAIA